MTGILATIIDLAYGFLLILLFARIIFSWINVSSYQLFQIRDLVYRLTEPLLAPIRRLLPPMAGFDLSPMILLFAVYFLRTFLLGLL